MNLLAIDTSSLACSVALQPWRRRLQSATRNRRREHTRLLMPMIRELLAEAGLLRTATRCDRTGQRSRLFHRNANRRVGGSGARPRCRTSTLFRCHRWQPSLRRSLPTSDADEVIVAQDAHMSEVYLGAFRRGAANLPQAIFPERLQIADADRGPGRVVRIRSRCGRFWLGAIPGARCGERQPHRVAVGCCVSQGTLSAAAR